MIVVTGENLTLHKNLGRGGGLSPLASAATAPGQFAFPPRIFFRLLKIRKLALTRTVDPNRSTSTNFVHGRSLYIVDCWMVVVEGGNVMGICYMSKMKCSEPESAVPSQEFL